MTPLLVLGIGLVSPLGRCVAEHLALVGAETALGRSARYRSAPAAADEGEELMACEWLPSAWLRPDMLGAARTLYLAELAATEALSSALAVDGTAPIRVRLIVDDTFATTHGDTLAQSFDRALSSLSQQSPNAGGREERRNRLLGASLLTGSCSLADALARAAEEEDGGATLIVAADSWLTHERMRARRIHSPWEPVALPASEGAAALLVMPQHAGLVGCMEDERQPLATLYGAASCQGTSRDSGVVDGAALTKLLRKLPVSVPTITRICGRTAGDIVRTLSLQYAVARAAVAGAALSPEHEWASLCHEIGDLGSAEFAAELVYALASSLSVRSMESDEAFDNRASHNEAALAWGYEDSGRFATCTFLPSSMDARLPNHRRGGPLREPPASKTTALHPAFIHADHSLPPAYARAALEELMDDLVYRTRDRWTLPLREQATVEARMGRQLRAVTYYADTLVDWLERDGELWPRLGENTDEELLAARAFANSHILARLQLRLPAQIVGDFVNSDLEPAALWAAAEGVAYGHARLSVEALAEQDGAGLRLIALEQESLLSQGQTPAEDELFQWLQKQTLTPERTSVRFAAACFRAASRLPSSPWSIEALTPWLDADDVEACFEVARLLVLMGTPLVERRLHDDAFVKRLGARTLRLAGLSANLPSDACFERWVGALEPTEGVLARIGWLGHPRSYGYLAHFLLDDRLADAGQSALVTAFGEPATPATNQTQRLSPDDWREHVRELHLDPERRCRGGEPWSIGVALSELASGQLSRVETQWRLDEVIAQASFAPVAEKARRCRLWSRGDIALGDLQQLHTLHLKNQ